MSTAVLYFRILMLSVFLLVAGSLAAQVLDQTTIDSQALIGERPPGDDGPTEISVHLHVLDIFSVDDVTQTYGGDFYLLIEWQDSRLALPEAQRRGQIRTLGLDSIWTPRVLSLNSRDITLMLPQVANVNDLGNVRVQQRISGSLAAQLEYKNFPFDTQIFSTDIVSYQYTPDEVAFSVQSSVSGEVSSFSAKGWAFRLLDPSIENYEVPSAGVLRPSIIYRIEARRISEYYLLTMFLPMSLIVFMAWTVFWIQPDVIPARIAISTASIFSLIAFGFTVRVNLPQVAYLTRADIFVLGCTLLVFLALGVAVTGSRWSNSDRHVQALRLNAMARWVYVLLFGVLVVGALYA